MKFDVFLAKNLTGRAASPMKANRRGVYEILSLDKEGHLGRLIKITD